MSPKTLTFLLFTLTLFSGCKNETPQNVNQKRSVANFKITLNVIVKKDDNFSLFYNQDGSTDFSKIAPIWVGVKGKGTEQKVIFTP